MSGKLVLDRKRRQEAESILFLTPQRSYFQEEAKELLSKAPGVMLIDDRDANRFPTPLDVSRMFPTVRPLFGLLVPLQTAEQG